VLEILSHGLGCILEVSDLVPFPRPDWRNQVILWCRSLAVNGFELHLDALQWSQGVCDDPFTLRPPEKYPPVAEEH
jgi:hypothetical protein